MQPLNKIIVSDVSFHSDELYKMIYSNISVVNLLREEGVDTQCIHPDAMLSYYVDYYIAEYNNGNFSQFVWNTGWSTKLNEQIEIGLHKMGATQHLQLFKELCKRVEQLPKKALVVFLESDYFGDNPTKEQLNDDAFFNFEEDVLRLNADWLRHHPDLEVLSIDQMFLAIEQYLGRKINR